jgi:negative regulator of sigma E activity
MPAFLTSIGMKLAAAGVVLCVIAGGWLYIGKLHAENAVLAASVSELQGANKQDAATIVQMQDDQKRYDAIESATLAADQGVAAQSRAEHAAVAGEAHSPVSPVLADTLNMLRGSK